MIEELPDGEKTLILNFGVAYNDPKFRLECRAKNIMDFRCPDERQNNPKNEQICKSLDIKSALCFP